MQWIKTALLAFALSLSFNATAMTDDEEAVWREAIDKGDLKTVKAYVKKDKEAIKHKMFGWSALQTAANANQLALVKYFIENGAELDYMQPFAHHTAFHVAALKRNKEITSLLAKSGADVNIKLRNNFPLIQYFRDHNDTEMIEHLQSLGVNDDGCVGEYC